MALKEQDIVFHTKDSNGNTVLQLPITRVENVEGALKTVNGNKPDSDGNIAPSQTGCLPLAGGSMTGTIAARHSIDDATAVPSSNQYQTALILKDNKNQAFGHIQTASYADSGKLLVKMSVADGLRNGNTYDGEPVTHFIGVGMDASGTPYTIAPNPPAADDSDQIATTAWVRNTFDTMIDAEGVVHIAGAETITGAKTFGATTTFNGVVNLNATVIGGAGRDIWVAHASGETSNRSVIQSGNAYADGASFYLNAKDYATNGGSFQINAHDGTNVKTLLGKPDGALTWDGKNVELVNSKGTNWIRYESGVQVCWGFVTIYTSNRVCTLPVAFSGTNYILQISSSYGTSEPTSNPAVINTFGRTSSSSFTTRGNYQNTADFIAIGRWK